MDKFPGDALAEIRELRARVESLEAQLRQRDGLTSASAGWKIGNMATPPAPASGGHLFAAGGAPFWKNSAGVISELITPSFPLCSAVTDPPDFTSAATAGATYDSATRNMLTDLRADAAGTKIALDNLLISLRNGDVLAG